MPGFDGLGLMLGEVAIKWTFRHLSHMMPMWIGMAADYSPGSACRRFRSKEGNARPVSCHPCWYTEQVWRVLL
jgi:hypothetical protein